MCHLSQSEISRSHRSQCGCLITSPCVCSFASSFVRSPARPLALASTFGSAAACHRRRRVIQPASRPLDVCAEVRERQCCCCCCCCCIVLQRLACSRAASVCRCWLKQHQQHAGRDVLPSAGGRAGERANKPTRLPCSRAFAVRCARPLPAAAAAQPVSQSVSQPARPRAASQPGSQPRQRASEQARAR